jgi:hypothetical protein
MFDPKLVVAVGCEVFSVVEKGLGLVPFSLPGRRVRDEGFVLC